MKVLCRSKLPSLYPVIGTKGTVMFPMMQQAPPKNEAEAQLQRLKARLNNVMLSPVKQLPMTLFLLWMVGNDISIFSIMFVSMAITGPFQAFGALGKAFELFDKQAKEDNNKELSREIFQAKLIYLACCAAALLVGVVKLSWMGLMPVSAVDWMDRREPAYSEFAATAFRG